MGFKKTPKYLTPEEAARRLKVLPSDILTWVKEEKLKGIRQKDGSFLIPFDDYVRFGSSFPEELREKMGTYLFASLDQIRQQIQVNVNKLLRERTQYVLNRASKAVQLLEKLHHKYEPHIDIFNNKRGSVACFVVYARIISLLNSSISLLKSSIPAESLILFRPLWEAILLAEYFMISEGFNENSDEIRKWFEKDMSPKPGKVRKYLSKKLKIANKTMNNLYRAYSKPVHHTYGAIMSSYRGTSMTGFLGEHQKRLGFDYHKSTIMRDIASLILAFEKLLNNALMTFHFCFSKALSLTEEECELINKEIDFYSLKPSDRLNIISESENTS